MADPTAPTVPAGSPIVPSALDLQVMQDAATLQAAPTELQILIGSLENLAAGVIPGLAAAGAAAASPALSPEAAAAATLLADWLKSLPAAQAASADATASAATTIASDAIAPAIAKLPVIMLLCMLSGAAFGDDVPTRIIVAGPTWFDHVVSILSAAMPWAICILGALVAIGKVVQPELAKRSPAIGNAIELVDHVADFLYGLLTSKAGKAQDAIAEGHTAALTGLLTQMQTASANPIVEAAVGAAIAKLPTAAQDAVKAIQSDLPIMLKVSLGTQAAPTDPATKPAA